MDIVEVTDDTAEAWRSIHNQLIPASPLSAEEVAERRGRHHLTLAYVEGELVGNATVRPPTEGSGTATVIVRVLPEHRRRGYGSAYLAAMLDEARARAAERIETVVLLANPEGLRFATRHGFTEIERYLADGAEYVDLVLDEAPEDGPGAP